jgi:ubiquinone/menaquinone biosynthesis C-methylase UbiE
VEKRDARHRSVRLAGATSGMVRYGASMDYDETAIATAYDAARGYRPEVLRRWLDLIAAHVPACPTLIVDLGCGTGRFTHPLAEELQTRVIGIDPSLKMLESARAKPGSDRVAFRQGSGEAIPLKDACADVIFMSMMLHHLKDRRRTAEECRRVLHNAGRVLIRNSTRDSIQPQRRFFPGIIPMIDCELPSHYEVVALFEHVGLRLIAYQCVAQRVAVDWNELADKLAMRADSFLARLPADEFALGMAALRAHAQRSDPSEAVIEDIPFYVFGS